MPVAGEQLIRRIIAWLARGNASPMSWSISTTCRTPSGRGRRRQRPRRPRALLVGAAGRPRQRRPDRARPAHHRSAHAFFIVNGDTLTDLALARRSPKRMPPRALVTMALVPNRDPDHYGGVLLTGDGRVTGFVRRRLGNRRVVPLHRRAGGGASAFAQLPEGEAIASLHGKVYDTWMASRPGSIRGHVCGAAFWDIGTPEDLARPTPRSSVRAGCKLISGGLSSSLAGSLMMALQSAGAIASAACPSPAPTARATAGDRPRFSRRRASHRTRRSRSGSCRDISAGGDRDRAGEAIGPGCRPGRAR